jgi:NAD(P)-dependent dehydrogenase (short-subunit alcohol dehydrogenase family)
VIVYKKFAAKLTSLQFKKHNKDMSTILVTGANGGLGLAVVKRLLEDDYQVIAVTGKDGAGNHETHPKLAQFEVDLMNENESILFIENAVKEYPGLDAAVLLVGGFAMGKLTDTGKADLDKMINLNFYTAFNVVRPLLLQFLKRTEGGRFILVGSRPGLNAAAGKDFFAYSLSKAMVFKLAEFINAEGKDKNITATVIVPSTIDTAANRKAMPDADFPKWVPAENIADAISFSLSGTGKMLRDNILKIYNNS